MTQPYTIYFAGELFSLKHLVGNALLADAINTISESRYQCIVPQDLELRETDPVAIRDQDLLHVISCDLGLFHFDGPELDSGTVVEFMFAKMLDIPSVILRSDFRKGGDADIYPWNLMAIGYPRTETVILNSMTLYQHQLREKGLPAAEAVLQATKHLALDVVSALDKVRTTPSRLSAEQREHIYRWASEFPGPSLKKLLSQETLKSILSTKIAKGLL